MGHWCRMCGRSRPNERFSGSGHKQHVCKECARLPAEVRTTVDQEREVFGYLTQSRISDKNLRRLKKLSRSSKGRIAELAALAFEIGVVKPHKRRRLKFLARKRRDLLVKLEDTGLIFAHHY